MSGENSWRRRLESRVREIMGSDPVHGWSHVQRVLKTALEICRREKGCDHDIVYAATLLHDVGRFMGEKGHHAEASAQAAPRILRESGFPPDKVDAVVHAILAHSYSLGQEPQSLEACVLRDADRLDAMGAVGVARAFMEGMRRGRGIAGTLQHFREKLLRLLEGLCTGTGRVMGVERHRFMTVFINQLCKEAPEECEEAGILDAGVSSITPGG